MVCHDILFPWSAVPVDLFADVRLPCSTRRRWSLPSLFGCFLTRRWQVDLRLVWPDVMAAEEGTAVTGSGSSGMSMLGGGKLLAELCAPVSSSDVAALAGEGCPLAVLGDLVHDLHNMLFLGSYSV